MRFDFKTDIVLENDIVRLTPLMYDDVELLLPTTTADKDLLQYSPKPVYSRQLLSEYIVNAIHERLAGTRYTFVIFSKKHSHVVGSTSFMNVSDEDEKLEIGATWIAKQYHGTGINTSCKELLLSYAFETLEAERVEFRTDERNTRSRKAIEKIGGKYEGTLRKNMRLYTGFLRSTVYYSILKDEYYLKKNE